MITNNQIIAALTIAFGLLVFAGFLGWGIGWWLSRHTKRKDPS